VVERPARAGGVANIIYAIVGILEGLLAFRLIFKLLGANPSSGFVNFIYDLSEPFVSPFYGIFPQATTEGVVTSSVFEPATLVAMLVYALIGWLVMRLTAPRTV
jgi:uncharacterized protein YggT (Ycf19 family)